MPGTLSLAKKIGDPMHDNKQEFLWAELLEMKSIGYLIRAK